MFTISASLVITSIYPCTSEYANVKCRTRDNTSPHSAFWHEKFHMTTGILKMKTANLAEKQKLFFFYPCGSVLLSTNLSLTPSLLAHWSYVLWQILIISSGRAVFWSLLLLITVAAIRSSKYKRHPKSRRNRWYSALFRQGSLIANTYPNV